MGLTLRLFGEFSAQQGTETLRRGERRAGERLLALLALHGPQPRPRLAGLLWPNSTEQLANFYLRRTLVELRESLGADAACLVAPTKGRRLLTLQLPDDACDLWRFTTALQSGNDAAAVALYTGPLLDGWTEDWVLTARQQLQQQFLDALEHVALQAQTPEEAILQLRKIVATEPERESAWRALMEALANRGDPGAVVQAYRELRLYLQNEIRISPSAQTLACYERLREEARRQAEQRPLPVALPSRRKLVPRPATPLLGRTEALETIHAQLRSSRLVTLVGLGGVGKTRLAVALLEQAEAESRYQDGVVWIDLAALLDPALVPARVASALALPEKQSVAEAIGEGNLLLAFDNCEHLLDAVAQLAEYLLTSCPQVRLLATSREPLGIAGETVWRVPPLSEEAAISLFESRARQAEPSWELTPENRPLVAELCHRLDDLALAIELAAACVPTLSLEKLIQRLNDRFSLLTGGSRTALPRQQTLRATMAWSWDRLSDRERSALRQLAIFASGFTLSAAEATCDQGIEVLSALVHKSLAVFDPTQERYRLLETVREYVLDRGLGEEGRLARERHLTYTLTTVRGWHNVVLLKGDHHSFDRLDASYDNVRVALTFALEHAPHTALELVGLLWPFWADRGFRQEGLRHLRTALTNATDAPAPLLSRAYLGAGALAYETGDFENTFSALNAAVYWAHEAGDGELEGEARRQLGLAHWNQGRIKEAQACYDAAIHCFAAGQHKRGIASVLACQGHLAWNLGDLAEATRCNLESQALYRTLGDLGGIAETSSHLGLIARSQNDFVGARSYLEEALALRRQLGLRTGIAVLVHHLGALAYFDRRLEDAIGYLNESIPLWKELGDPGWAALSLYFLGLVYRVQRQWALAAEVLQEALPIRQAQNATRSIAAIQFALGTVRLEQGRLAEAGNALRESARLRLQIGLPEFCSESLDALAALWARRSEFVRAAELLGCAQTQREGRGELEEDHPYRDEAHRAALFALGEVGYAQAVAHGEQSPVDQLLAAG